jgi:class 3 adenylate cyclase
MTQAVSDTLRAAREAARRHAWTEALELYEAAESEQLSAQDLEQLAEAAWWLGRGDLCIAARERAHAAYLAEGDRRRAGVVALGLAEDHFHRLAGTVGSGWLNSAERLLEEELGSVEHGYLVRTQAVIAFEGRSDYPAALELARQACRIGAETGNRDLQALGLHDQGRILVAMGRVAEGMSLMDEAMVAAVGGGLGPMATGRIYCNMIGICEKLADYRRAGEWTEAARRWCERVGHDSGFPGLCRVHRAEIMRLRGAWAEAEQEARRACGELTHFLDFTGEAFYEIGQIRLHMGDPAGAEEAFRQAHQLGRDPEPGLALLRLSEGRPGAAAELIEQALANESLGPLDRARLLPAQVEVSLDLGDLERAAQGGEELERIAGEYGSSVLEAAARYARGRLRLERDEPEAAAQDLKEAWQLWKEADLPFEAARARSMLGVAYRRQGKEELAELELEAARSAFQHLGAVPELRRVTDLLGTPAIRGAKTLMFTDMVRSTELIGAIGDEAWEQLIRWHDETLRSLFASHKGREIDHAGDGFFVAFEDSQAAADCAKEIQRALAEHRRKTGFAPQVRIGLHAAEVGDSFKGRAVHEAARIGSLAGGGEILASRHTVEPLAGLRFSDPRSVDLKGIDRPMEVVAVEWR